MLSLAMGSAEVQKSLTSCWTAASRSEGAALIATCWMARDRQRWSCKTVVLGLPAWDYQQSCDTGRVISTCISVCGNTLQLSPTLFIWPCAVYVAVRCDLVDSFCRAATKQQAWPRENVRSYMEPPAINSSKVAAAAARATFPAWIELMQSVDSTDVIDWSDAENDGWGVAAEQHSSGNSTCSSSNGSSSPQPPAAAAAVAGATGSRGALWSGMGGCLSSSRLVGVWSSSCSRRGISARAVVVRAAPTGKQVDTE
jgi:hypothetical protein